ncbi:PucR family transcriptional regulator ligand-binding domain-containing protein [Sporosarcina sp. resist]|uniref:PucR family transcriptional regulator n=1 Tax=Sporosarcina sp. resist TaxID=2762563 RepID=UPI00164D3B1B|nr:PucR family transcriptional regulator [Sporosarcina sp. resist]QNK87509.1 PucR family transcriptional regulator ligand-binding domain-containing protein [Sporosarcina sp. resist]
MLFKKLMELNLLEESEVLTTCPFRSQMRNVTFIDSPDGSHWIKEGDFILTTGYFASGTDDWEVRFHEFIKGLIDREAFGLGVKIGRHIPYLPKEIQQYACENDFPIIKLNNKPAWSNFLLEITHALSEAKDDEIYQLNNIYEKFHNHLKNKGDMLQLAKVLYSIIKMPLTIYFKKMNLRIDYPEQPNHNINLDYLISTAFNGISNQIQRVKYEQTLFLIKWINEKNTLEGGIFVWSGTDELTPKIKIAVEQAAIIANLEVEHQNIINAIEQRHLNDFILELVNNSFESEYYVQKKMKSFDLKVANDYRLLLIHIEHDNQIFKENLIHKVKFMKKFELNQILVGQNYDSNFIILIPEDFFESTTNELFSFIDTNYSTIKMKCGTSRPYSILELSKAHREAKISLMISKENQVSEEKIISTNFECLNLERIIFSEEAIEEAREIYSETLQKIIAYDNKNKSELLNTLYSYLEYDLNVEKTGKRLFIHKNTVRYRLKLISTLLSANLDSLNTIILLRIAFTYFHFVGDYRSKSLTLNSNKSTGNPTK